MHLLNTNRNVKPKTQFAKKLIVTTGFFALGRVLESSSHFDENIKTDLNDWPEGFSFTMKVIPNGPSLSMKKEANILKFLGIKELKSPDMLVEVKNLDTAFKMITAQLGAHHVYAQHKIGVIGNIADSMKLIRMIYVAEDYLFPPILSKRIVKEISEPSVEKLINRFRVLVFGLLLGK
jgi:hypothetical protein